MLCSDSRNDVPPVPQRNVSIAAERGAVRPSTVVYTGGFFHCYIEDESICHLRGCTVYFVAFILFLMENPVSKQCRP